MARRIKASVCTKQYGYEDLLCPLIAQVFACTQPLLEQRPICRQSCAVQEARLMRGQTALMECTFCMMLGQAWTGVITR